MDNKKKTNRLDAQELEKRKASFAAPIVHREGEGRTGSTGLESVGGRRAPEPDAAPQTSGPLPKAPIVDRNN